MEEGTEDLANRCKHQIRVELVRVGLDVLLDHTARVLVAKVVQKPSAAGRLLLRSESNHLLLDVRAKLNVAGRRVLQQVVQNAKSLLNNKFSLQTDSNLLQRQVRQDFFAGQSEADDRISVGLLVRTDTATAHPHMGPVCHFEVKQKSVLRPARLPGSSNRLVA